MGFYSDNPRFYVAVDCIIFGIVGGRLCLLLARRRFDPEKGKWSVMGGFVQQGESVSDAARRVLLNLTGLRDIYMEQVGAFGAVDRDPGERVVSVAYYALLGPDDYDPRVLQANSAEWIPLDHLPPLGFDHPLMIESALKLIRSRFSTEPLGFNLLPPLFTLSQLQTLHETIQGQPLDKRNFRKRVAETPSIVKTDLIDKNSSRRGASLYRFDPERFSPGSKFVLK